MENLKFRDVNDGLLEYCQISGSSEDLVEVIDLGFQPLSDTLLDRKNLSNKEKLFPLKVYRNIKLGSSQLNYVVPHEELYHLDYPYRPGITKEIIEHHKEQAEKNIKKLKIKEGSLVVDIGSNDGTLLKQYKNKNMKVLGIEPTNMAQVAIKDGVASIQRPFDNTVSKEIVKKFGSAKLITATNVFAHMAKLNSFMLGVLDLLSDDGYFIIENHNMKDIIKYNQYDTFYHEHIRNYSFISLKYLFESYNLKIIDADVVERYNGSIRVVVTKNHKHPEIKNIANIIQDEIDFGILDAKVWDNFKNNILSSKKELNDLLKTLKKDNKTIAGNSCPARASTLLNFCDISTNLIPYIAEQPTSFKLDKFLPGKRIPIVNNQRLFDEQPDYVLILAWHLSKPIIDQLKQRGLKSKFILPLPKVTIVE